MRIERTLRGLHDYVNDVMCAEAMLEGAEEIEKLRALLRYAQGFIPAKDKDMHQRIDAALKDQP